MATEIAHAPAAAREALDLNSGTEKLSGILGRGQPEAEEPAPEPEEAMEAASVEETEQSEQEMEAPAEEQPEATETPAKEAKPKEPKEPEVTSEIELEPAQVAQMLGLDEDAIEVDDDGGIQIHAKVNGKPATVSLSDLRHSYELAQTHEDRLRQLGRDRKAFEEQSKAVLEGMSNQHQQFSAAVEALEQEYANDFRSIDWTTLRNDDPTEYNARRMDYEDRRRRIEEYKAKAQAQGQELQQKHQEWLQSQQADGAKRLAEVFEGESYRGAPKWDQEESKRLAEWIVDQGFSPQDVAGVGVWQIFKWARDSMLREQELKQAKETVKKVAKLPKVVKPGTKRPASQVKRGRSNDLKARQRKSGGALRETTEVIRDILNR